MLPSKNFSLLFPYYRWFFENYRITIIKFLFIYRHRRIFYQKLDFPITVRYLKHWIPNIFYSNYRNTLQKIGKYRIPRYRTPPPLWRLNEPCRCYFSPFRYSIQIIPITFYICSLLKDPIDYILSFPCKMAKFFKRPQNV